MVQVRKLRVWFSMSGQSQALIVNTVVTMFDRTV